MGQYWKVVNLDKREFLDQYKLGAGAKLWEHLANSPGTGAALLVLCAAMPERRGGGDFDMGENWHGPERVDMTKEGPPVPDYFEIAKRTIGRWAGDRVALVGDYAEDGDLAPEHKASLIYGLCRDPKDYDGDDPSKLYTDITDDVVAVIEHELGGKFVGDGWKTWKTAEELKKDAA
jgi:hypothetical protein